MSEATNDQQTVTELSDQIAATATIAQQGDTKSDGVVEGADTKGSTLLDSEPNKDTQTDDAKAEDGKSDLLGDIEQQDAEKAPDKYEPFTLADGTEMDATDVEILSAIAKEHNLSQESAQKAALVANDLVEKMVKNEMEYREKKLQENADTWKKQDPNGELTMLARKAMQKLGDEAHAHFKEAGYLNDARVMSLLADYGRLISEGKSISGKPAPTQSLLYPQTPELYNYP